MSNTYSPEIPQLTVVVPTRGRAVLTDRLLSSLREVERTDGVPIDIALYDDSAAEDAVAISSSAERYGARLVTTGPCVRSKRNRGAAESRSEIILYLDSDTEAQAGLLSAHLAAYQSDNVGGAAGITEFVGGAGPLWESVRRSRFLNAFSFARRMDTVPWATCSNVSYRRSLVIELGGFDTTLPSNYGGDDADFGMRVTESGHRIAAAPSALVTHAAETWLSLGALWNRARRWGQADFHLWYVRRPERLRGRIIPPSIRFIGVWIAGVGALALLQAPLLLASWLVFAPTVTIVVSSMLAARSQGELGRWWYYVMDDLFGWVFELSTVWEGVRCGSVAPLLSAPVRGPVLPLHRRARWTGQRVALAASVLLLAVHVLLAVIER